MNRRDFKEIARIRLREASVLLRSRNYSGAYYLCGYVVECGLKACIAKRTRQYDFPPSPRQVQKVYSHKLQDLVQEADLELTLSAALTSDPTLAAYWTIAKRWSEESRYEKHTQLKARDLYDAVSDQAHGVLQWIEQYW